MAADAPFSFIPFGATLQAFVVDGVNLVQGFPTADLYRTHNFPFFGATVGRVANRIKGARLESLNGSSYPLAANNGPNTLHGGNVGWDKRDWQGPTPVGVRQIPGVEGLKGGESVQFKLVSQDGEEGFPGTLEVKCTYTTGTQVVGGKEATVLGIEYEAQLVGGAEETVINMTNHSYFNLAGNPTIEGTEVELVTNDYLPIDDTGIPTEGPKPFKLETKKPFVLGATEPDLDDCFVVDANAGAVPIDTRGSPLTRLVAASHPQSRIHLEVWSTEPAFQFYTGKYVDVPAVTGAPARGPRAGFCVEPSRYVNAINVPEWKNQVLLKKGETYGARIVYKGWKE